MKKLLALVLSMSLAVSVTACGGSSGPPAVSAPPAESSASASAESTSGTTPGGDPINIGVITTLTGEKAMIGDYTKSSCALAVEEINAAGGVLGRPVAVIYEDDQGTDAGAVNAFNKLANDKTIVGVIGSNSSTRNLAIEGDVKKTQIVTMAQGSNVKLSNLDNDWMFQARANDATYASGMARYGVEKLKKTRFAVIHDTDIASKGQADQAIATLKELGITPVEVVAYNTGDKDFTPQLVKIQQANPDCIIGASIQVEAGLILKQMKALGISVPLIGTSSFSSSICLELAGDAAEGVYSATDFVPGTTRERGIEYCEKIRESTGKDPDSCGAIAYDAFYLLCEAMTRAQSTENTKIKDAMHTITDYKGTTTIFNFEGRMCGGTEVLMAQYKDGKLTIVDTIS